MQSPGIRLHLPLTPAVAVAIFDPDLPLPLPTSGLVESSWVRGVNRMVVRAALRHVISPRPDFDAARRMVADDPRLRTSAHHHADWTWQNRFPIEDRDTEVDDGR